MITDAYRIIIKESNIEYGLPIFHRCVGYDLIAEANANAGCKHVFKTNQVEAESPQCVSSATFRIDHAPT